MADGIYRPDQGIEQTIGDRTATFRLTEGIIIKGGYASFGESTPDARGIRLYRTILSGDRPEEIHLMDSTLVAAYSNVQYARQGPWPGIGNLNTDPLFVDYRAGDYHLRPGSPCINSGDPNRTSKADETDIDGEERIMGGRIDMGADEFCP